MSTRNNDERLLTIGKFLSANPTIPRGRLMWALRHRETNGFGAYVFRTPTTGKALLIKHPLARVWFQRAVPA